jgi:hypothetical protein
MGVQFALVCNLGFKVTYGSFKIMSYFVRISLPKSQKFFKNFPYIVRLDIYN